MTVAEDLLEIAKKDFEACNVLYEQKIYNVFVFQLQQSIEKLVKSYGIEAGIIEEKDLRKKISHLPHKVFARYFGKKLEQERILAKPTLLSDMIPPHQRQSEKTKQDYIDGLERVYKRASHVSLDEMSKISSLEIKEVIEGFKSLEIFEYDEEARLKLIRDDFKKSYEHYKYYFKTVIKEDENAPSMQLFDLMLSNMEELTLRQLQEDKALHDERHKITQIFYAWYNLSVITSPHEQTSRYPSQTGPQPLKVYTAKHPIVENFEEIKFIITKTTQFYTELLSTKGIVKAHQEEFKVIDTVN